MDVCVMTQAFRKNEKPSVDTRPVTEKIAFKKFVLRAFRSSNPIKTFPIKHLTLVKMLSSNIKVNNGIRFQVN